MADRADLDAGTVIAHCLFHPPLNRVLVAVFFHIDEIDDNQARQITQPQLACQFIGRLKVGFQRGFLDVALTG